MSPRRYRSDRRKAATEETRCRIIDSTVALHAEHGVLATTYAMIAKHADVATPTVYNHFPTRADLLAACTSQTAAQAPPLGPEIFADDDGLETRMGKLVQALFANYAYYAPWLRWASHEAQVVPELAGFLNQANDQRQQLTLLALQPAFITAPPPELLACLDILLDFSAWRSLTEQNAFSPDRAERVLSEALLAVIRQQSATFPADAGHRGKQPNERSKT